MNAEKKISGNINESVNERISNDADCPTAEYFIKCKSICMKDLKIEDALRALTHRIEIQSFARSSFSANVKRGT